MIFVGGFENVWPVYHGAERWQC